LLAAMRPARAGLSHAAKRGHSRMGFDTSSFIGRRTRRIEQEAKSGKITKSAKKGLGGPAQGGVVRIVCPVCGTGGDQMREAAKRALPARWWGGLARLAASSWTHS